MRISSYFSAVILSSVLATGGFASGGLDGEILADEKLLSRDARDFLLDGPWLYKVRGRSKDLTVEDLNGDGLVDIAMILNERSLLEIFYQKKGADSPEEMFDQQSVTLDRIIRDMVARDVNGDGRMDLVMAGSPSKLVVMYQDKDGKLQPPVESELEADRVVTGDINGDGKEDLLVYQEKRFDILLGETRGLGLEPTETFYTTGDPASDPMILDFDGDGLMDIVYHDSMSFQNLVVRLQSPEKTFPSEFRTSTSILRVVSPLNRGKGKRGAIVAVQNQTRSLVSLELTEPDTDDEKSKKIPLSEIQTISFDPATRSGKTYPCVVDFDGDGRRDLILYSSEQSQVRLLRQTRTGALVESLEPSFQGVTEMIPFPTEKGKPTPLVMLSPSERAVCYVKYDEKEKVFPFPKVLPISGDPVGIALLKIKGKQALAVLSKPQKGQVNIPVLTGYSIDGDGKVEKLGEWLYTEDKLESGFILENVDAVGLEALDLNRDGLDDLIVYADFKPAVPFLQNKDGKFEAVDATSGVLEGLLTGARPANIDAVSLDPEGKEVSTLAIKDKFARAFHLDKDGNVVIEQQFNGINNVSRINDATIGHLRNKDSVDVLLLDRGNRTLNIYGREDGAYDILTEFQLDEAEYSAVEALDLDGDQKDDVLLIAEDRISIIYSHLLHGGLATRGTGKPVDEEGGYGMVRVLDLIKGGDGEIVSIEVKNNLMDFFTVGKDEEGNDALLRFYSFKIFDDESNILRRVNLDALPEPREIVVEDIDDDGKNDVITLTHDKLIVYKQIVREAE